MLYLVRHGRAAAGVEDLDPGLDDLGHTQARAAATALLDVGARRLVVSPLRRTRETAEPIAKALGLTPEISDEVAEVFDPELAVADRRAMLGPLLSGRWSEQNEALRGFRDRVLAALVSFGQSGEPTIVVSHFVAISVGIGAALGEDRVSPLAVPNASITRVELRAGVLGLIEAGGVAHLSGDQVTHAHTARGGIRS
jgi:broad specificity phosphatase PhoE